MVGTVCPSISYSSSTWPSRSGWACSLLPGFLHGCPLVRPLSEQQGTLWSPTKTLGNSPPRSVLSVKGDFKTRTSSSLIPPQ